MAGRPYRFLAVIWDGGSSTRVMGHTFKEVQKEATNLARQGYGRHVFVYQILGKMEYKEVCSYLVMPAMGKVSHA